MPSEEALLATAEEWKTKGNEAFSKASLEDAISAYSQGIVACDRLQTTTTTTTTPAVALLKATLLSNRAMCHLKVMQLQACIDDCSKALELEPSDIKLCNKLLFRRSKARFLLASLPGSAVSSTDLSDSAKDLLKLLQTDPKNSEANQLLLSIRAQHKQLQTAVTPVSKTLDALKKGGDDGSDYLLHQLKLLLGMLDNDLTNTAMEMGRLGGVELLLNLANKQQQEDASTSTAENKKLSHFAIQCISIAGSHPAFCRAFLVNIQKDLLALVQTTCEPEVVVSAIAVYLRLILHADRDDPNMDVEITGKTLLEYDTILQTLSTALRRFQAHPDQGTTVIRAVLDLINTFTAGEDRDAMIRQSLALTSSGGTTAKADPTLPVPKTQAEVRAMTPPQYAAHRKREYETKTRNQAWAFERSMLLLSSSSNNNKGIMPVLLETVCLVQDHVVRRELTVMLGRLLAILEDEDKIKNIVRPLLQDDSKEGNNGPIIEEVYNEDGDEEKEFEEDVVTLETKMARAAITAALLLSKKALGAWALTGGWAMSGDELPQLIQSGDKRAMCLASEVVSAAATVEQARHIVGNLTSCGDMETLLMCDDCDIRSGAASAVAKLGLSNKDTQTDEGEVMGMLQAACELLEDEKQQDDATASSSSAAAKKADSKSLRHFSSFATSSVERAVEMINYLIFHTVVKDELAAGFKPSYQSTMTALERLVKTADIPNAGESLSGFALATIFQHMAATNLQIRKEGFEGKEVTMEQYDEMQKMGKTAEEKEVMEAEQDPDTQASCNERIRKMASANVPRALVALVEKASEHTLEEVAMALNRMAGEPSVRGIMIQQGVLTACIKIEKNEGPTETDTLKKVIRLARHCIAKMLVTTNPSLLTSAQKLGSIRPLISLVRDSKASDLQQFEALLSLTNLGSSGDDAKNRIVSEKGIPAFHFAMFSDHEMVRRAATECMSNLVPHEAMMEHLGVMDNLKLWLAFASDYEDNYECARAAAGCLAMATQMEEIALEMVELEKFRTQMEALLECGRLEIMHRALVIVLNLVLLGGATKEKAVSEGLVAFCDAYEKSCMANGTKDLDFSEEEAALLPVTMELAQKIVQEASA